MAPQKSRDGAPGSASESHTKAKPTDEALTALGHRIGGQFQGYETSIVKVRNVASRVNTTDRLFLNDLLSDMTVVAEGTRLPAHRIVLYSQSSFFRAALSVEMKVRRRKSEQSLYGTLPRPFCLNQT